MDLTSPTMRRVRDLIDTLWNVKALSIQVCFSAVFRFNRYIVECKGFNTGDLVPFYLGFNRYIVECKGGSINEVAIRQQRFNRYIVECKGFR